MSTRSHPYASGGLAADATKISTWKRIDPSYSPFRISYRQAELYMMLPQNRSRLDAIKNANKEKTSRQSGTTRASKKRVSFEALLKGFTKGAGVGDWRFSPLRNAVPPTIVLQNMRTTVKKKRGRDGRWKGRALRREATEYPGAAASSHPLALTKFKAEIEKLQKQEHTNLKFNKHAFIYMRNWFQQYLVTILYRAAKLQKATTRGEDLLTVLSRSQRRTLTTSKGKVATPAHDIAFSETSLRNLAKHAGVKRVGTSGSPSFYAVLGALMRQGRRKGMRSPVLVRVLRSLAEKHGINQRIKEKDVAALLRR